jgi:hypothetical protein
MILLVEVEEMLRFILVHKVAFNTMDLVSNKLKAFK